MTANSGPIAIVGSGSAAFAAAIRAVEEGARVALVEGGGVGWRNLCECRLCPL